MNHGVLFNLSRLIIIVLLRGQKLKSQFYFHIVQLAIYDAISSNSCLLFVKNNIYLKMTY